MYIVESTISLFQDKKYRTRESVTDREEKDYDLSDREVIEDKDTDCGRGNLGEDVISCSCCESQEETERAENNKKVPHSQSETEKSQNQ